MNEFVLIVVMCSQFAATDKVVCNREQTQLYQSQGNCVKALWQDIRFGANFTYAYCQKRN
jgi:hypothetical protein